jgi:hypothetical protein
VGITEFARDRFQIKISYSVSPGGTPPIDYSFLKCMNQDKTSDNREKNPSTPVKRDKLFLVNGRFTTVHYPDRVSIVEIRDPGNISNVHPLASIPVDKTMTDAEACLLALHWLRNHNYITAAENDSHEESCMTAASRGQLKVLRHEEQKN